LACVYGRKNTFPTLFPAGGYLQMVNEASDKELIREYARERVHRWIVVAGIISLAVGAALSRAIEPGVRVEKVMLTPNTPALRVFPATPGPHPIALLAHGATGSKETLFCFGEALAAAGFDCYSVDQAGHGESP
jgi:hypothetical protein